MDKPGAGRSDDECFFKQKTAYEITYGDWSSDVCSSDLLAPERPGDRVADLELGRPGLARVRGLPRLGIPEDQAYAADQRVVVLADGREEPEALGRPRLDRPPNGALGLPRREGKAGADVAHHLRVAVHRGEALGVL